MGAWIISINGNPRPQALEKKAKNTKKIDASVDGNLANDGDSTSIFSKVLGRELSNSLSSDIYLRYWINLYRRRN